MASFLLAALTVAFAVEPDPSDREVSIIVCQGTNSEDLLRKNGCAAAYDICLKHGGLFNASMLYCNELPEPKEWDAECLTVVPWNWKMGSTCATNDPFVPDYAKLGAELPASAFENVPPKPEPEAVDLSQLSPGSQARLLETLGAAVGDYVEDNGGDAGDLQKETDTVVSELYRDQARLEEVAACVATGVREKACEREYDGCFDENDAWSMSTHRCVTIAPESDPAVAETADLPPPNPWQPPDPEPRVETPEPVVHDEPDPEPEPVDAVVETAPPLPDNDIGTSPEDAAAARVAREQARKERRDARASAKAALHPDEAALADAPADDGERDQKDMQAAASEVTRDARVARREIRQEIAACAAYPSMTREACAIEFHECGPTNGGMWDDTLHRCNQQLIAQMDVFDPKMPIEAPPMTESQFADFREEQIRRCADTGIDGYDGCTVLFDLCNARTDAVWDTQATTCLSRTEKQEDGYPEVLTRQDLQPIPPPVTVTEVEIVETPAPLTAAPAPEPAATRGIVASGPIPERVAPPPPPAPVAEADVAPAPTPTPPPPVVVEVDSGILPQPAPAPPPEVVAVVPVPEVPPSPESVVVVEVPAVPTASPEPVVVIVPAPEAVAVQAPPDYNTILSRMIYGEDPPPITSPIAESEPMTSEEMYAHILSEMIGTPEPVAAVDTKKRSKKK